MKLKAYFILIIPILLHTTTTAQNIKKTLINNNLDELFINKDNPFGSIPEKAVDNYFSEISNIYIFEIVYNDNIIFRESILKSLPQSRDSETIANQFRFKYNTIYLDASIISDSDKLKLLESRKNKMTQISGKQLIALNDFLIIKKDYSKSKYVIISPLETMKINVYKISQ